MESSYSLVTGKPRKNTAIYTNVTKVTNILLWVINMGIRQIRTCLTRHIRIMYRIYVRDARTRIIEGFVYA